MDSKALLALAERVEGASWADRETDRAVARLIGWHRVEPRHTRNKHGAWIAPEDFNGVYSGGAPILDSLHGTDMHRDVPSFTGSLDAAVTLWPGEVPHLIPSDPRICTAMALRALATSEAE